MELEKELRRVAAAHRSELEGDLDQARHALSRSRQNVAEIERRVCRLEALLELAADIDAEKIEGEGLTLHEAMKQVLRTVPERMLRPADLARQVTLQGLYRMRDGRPVETQQIHARVGNYPHLFVRKGTFIALTED
jgi:hypothetical protein